MVRILIVEDNEELLALVAEYFRNKGSFDVFTQVIMNLLSNCDRYGKKGSVVDISIALDALTITNKTDKKYDDVDSLKKPFVKGDDSRGNKGAGLGVAIADNNLDLLGYKLELSSESDEFRAKVRFKK